MESGVYDVVAGCERKGATMLPFKERYIVDADGSRIGVVLDIKEYQQLLEELWVAPHATVVEPRG